MQAEVCIFIKKETLAQVFSCEFCEIFKNIFFTEHLRWLLLIHGLLFLKRSFDYLKITCSQFCFKLKYQIDWLNLKSTGQFYNGRLLKIVSLLVLSHNWFARTKVYSEPSQTSRWGILLKKIGVWKPHLRCLTGFWIELCSCRHTTWQFMWYSQDNTNVLGTCSLGRVSTGTP